jgi:hypothetical protein
MRGGQIWLYVSVDDPRQDIYETIMGEFWTVRNDLPLGGPVNASHCRNRFGYHYLQRRQ